MADGLMCPLRQDYGRRADQLNLKEKELRSKEAELRKLEQDLRSSGGLKPEKNWPPCCAFTHHDIAGEASASSPQLCWPPSQGWALHLLPPAMSSAFPCCLLWGCSGSTDESDAELCA